MPIDNPLQTAIRDGVTLSYLDTGAGIPSLLFVHGWCCDHTFWRAQVLNFQDRHWTVAVDLRGHGASAKPDQDYTIAGFTADLAWLCRQIGLDKPIVVGHSMGGVIGMNLVRQHPELARALVMVDSPIVPLPDALQQTAQAVLAGLQSPTYADIARNFVSTFMFRQDSPPGLKASIVQGMSAAPQRVMWTALSDTLNPANIAPGPIPVPTLYVRAATQIAPASGIEARYPGISVEEFDAAHFLMMEKPDHFNQLLRRFIQEVA